MASSDCSGAARAPTERFSDRVADYVRARPGYPLQLLPWLMRAAALAPGDAVAELGAGTGIFTRCLLDAGLRVTAVEPNQAMRAAADAALSRRPGYASRAGRAEATGLAGGGYRLVVAAQAFHWFDVAATRAECRRLLAPRGQVALIWNLRRNDGAFAQGYEALLQRHCPEYAGSGVPAQADEAAMQRFFASAPQRAEWPNAQQMDLPALRARLLSSSYAPPSGATGHAAMMAELEALFARCQTAGTVTIEYAARVYLGTP